MSLFGCDVAEINVSLDTLSQATSPYVFDVIGDTRGSDYIYPALVNLMVGDNPVMIFNVGDFTNSPCTGVHAFLKRSQMIKVPYLLAPGNHDIGSDKGNCYLKWSRQPGLYFDIPIGSRLFMVLNSEDFSNTQLQWIRGEFARHQDKTKFVFLHKPLFANKIHQQLPESIRTTLHQLFKASKVVAVFQGHDHLYSREVVDGISYIVTGGGGAPLFADGFYHYIRVTVTKDVHAEVVAVDGTVKSAFRFPAD